MKKMQRFEVLDITDKNDARLTFEGQFNDYAFGSGDSRKAALQFAIELIQDEGKVAVSDGLYKAVEKADDLEFGGPVQLAVRYFYDNEAEEAEVMGNITALVEQRRAERLALIEQNGEVLVEA